MSLVKKPRKPRKKMSPEEKAEARRKREEKKFRLSIKDIFLKSGFKYIKSESKEFTLSTTSGNRTTELDGVFVYENIVILVEDTCTASPNKHLASKQVFFGLALQNQEALINCLADNLSDFKAHFDANQFTAKDYVTRITYFSMHSVDSEHVENAVRAGVYVIEKAITNYFSALVKTVAESAIYEIFQYLQINFSDIGESKISGGNQKNVKFYKGFLLPENNSSYPDGYKVISFYADPDSLLKKSFVLRKNSWQNPNFSYQRVLDIKKIKLMRKYLCDSKRVYVNNIIATLPPSTKIHDEQTSNQLTAAELEIVKPIQISLPDEYNVVGLIDGQHRVFSYHKGSDTFEKEILKLRKKQNLLVTGIIYPEGTTDDARVQFEAKLFLEINDRQTKVKSALTQEIELIVNPYSATAIAKAIVIKLARSGALKDKLEEHVFDDAKKLKIASIISYGLKPLIKKDGEDSLFTAWDEPQKKDLILLQKDRSALEEYIEFCFKEVNTILNAVKISAPDKWKIGDEEKLLTPTSINGFIRCLRFIIENGETRTLENYKSKLSRIREFDFKPYKSSHWNNLGTDLYNKYF
ncbi:DGQHR domain-containing protein [Pseudomonas nitroreducens]|uniref:DGQHR domain-containing protein n=1 Tax=Pseudomonas nitroreducens TaxID=46680 RepID=UPI00209D2000|nr:DGQHR domain-containing protein [Pseudomonas nitroreducens]MCP1622852.1 DGQHR domain-containing protein [Pseudomonas nitroreducens]